MGQLSKSIFLTTPANVVYEAIKNVDTSRYTSDLGGSSPKFDTDIPNTLLVLSFTKSGFWTSAKLRWEYSFRPISDSSCEVTTKIDYENFDENFLKNNCKIRSDNEKTKRS